MGLRATQFISQSLAHQTIQSGGAALSYTESSEERIVNVSMLGARLLMRASAAASGGPKSAVTPADGERMKVQASRLLQFALSEQLPSGFWRYAAERRGGWIDSYHSGFVLEALMSLTCLGLSVPTESLHRGLRAYSAFFDADGGARYSSGERSFYDAHSAAQGVITYSAAAATEELSPAVRLDASDRSNRVLGWALRKLWLPAKGYFAYGVFRGRREEQEYSRWVQAWMALALGTAVGARNQAEVVGAQGAP
jgi:hypothetical protein